MRSEGQTWRAAATTLSRNVSSLKKRFYNLPNNGSEGRKRIKLGSEQSPKDVAADKHAVEGQDEDRDCSSESDADDTEPQPVAARETLLMLSPEKTGLVDRTSRT